MLKLGRCQHQKIQSSHLKRDKILGSRHQFSSSNLSISGREKRLVNCIRVWKELVLVLHFLRIPFSFSLHRSYDSSAYRTLVVLWCPRLEVLPAIFLSPTPPLILFSVTGACSFPIVWGLLAGLRFCASLNVGAGCRKWTPLDTSGSQPPFNDAVL